MTDQVFVDRQGRQIDKEMCQILQASPGYIHVRSYSRDRKSPGEYVYARVNWVGHPKTPFTFSCSHAPDVCCEDELSAVSQYEDFLVSMNCGAWYPSGGTLNKFGKQVSTRMTFWATNNELTQKDMPLSEMQSISENPKFGSW